MVPVVYVRVGNGLPPVGDPDTHPTLRFGQGHGSSGPAFPIDPSDGVSLDAETEVSATRDGPFTKLAVAIEDDAGIRAVFATSQRSPMLERYRGIRLYLLLGLVPLLMLAELDRELSRAGVEGAGVRLLTHLFLAAVVASDLIRLVPRHPRTSALVLFGAATRYALLLSKTCGHGVHLVIFVAPIVAVMAGVALITAAPSPTRVTREVRERLGITPRDVARVRKNARPTLPHLASAVVAGVGLPVTLLCAQISGIGTWWQALLFAMYAAAVPWTIAQIFEPRVRLTWPPWPRIVSAVIVGFALTLGITNGAHYGFDATVYAARCHDPSAFEGGTAKKLLDAENIEVTKNVHQAREQWAYFAMTVLVVPIAEERVYRGLLQRLLVRRLGSRRGIGLAALCFGLAHLGVYRVAVYQTVLLGASFGVAYGAGGIAASALTHALWNLHLLM